MRSLPSPLAAAEVTWRYSSKNKVLDYSGADRSVVVSLEEGAPTPVFVGGEQVSTVRYASGVIGGNAPDSLAGDRRPNRLQGMDGDDWLRGRGGPDVLDGGPGRDTLAGGSGADLLTGGAGADRFLYSSVSETRGDIITDFSHDQGDVIQFVFADTLLQASVQDGFKPDPEHPLPLSFHGTEPEANALWYCVAGNGKDITLLGDTDGHVDTQEIQIVLRGVAELQPSDVVFQYGIA
ncbi:hypothetical protein HEQ72_03900 [Haematospirillum sp. 15-248]|uniref:hypothetical protein n=1 Tax=Haematospirillum sp. 15-248 TaxID=2723107 RepID=UPI0014390B4B|nr:hypothetical protein [Haematospirillum sp. 15-248]NKD87454.1 hypothetical protein [Haematospirillum sp. 15-248]